MSYFFVISLVLASVTVFIYFLLVIFWKRNAKHTTYTLATLPDIAVLVAARNEAQNIASCIEALLALDYPTGKVQIWVGNDGSSDDTGNISRRYAQQFERVKVIDIHEKLGQADAKANVLAHLIRASATARQVAPFLLITDADTRVNPGWAKGMLQQGVGEQTGVVTGVTLIRGKSKFARMQCLDWLIGLGMVKVASEFGKPITTLGSNMMVGRQAYQATGGYENMPFSITEDYALLHNTYQRGFFFRNVIDASVLAESLPIGTVKELLQQRIRWMHGAMQLPGWLVVILFILTFFYPALVFIAISDFLLACALFFFKIAAESIFAAGVMQALNLDGRRKKKLLALLPLYGLYTFTLSISMIILFFLPHKVRWKERDF